MAGAPVSAAQLEVGPAASQQASSASPARLEPPPSVPQQRGPHGGGAQRLELDTQGRSVRLDGQPVALTGREYLLMELLLLSRGRLFSRSDLLERLWGLNFAGDARIVDTYVKRVRGKLGQDAVETVRGLGYRCPLQGVASVAQPHLGRLPPEARLLTRLAQRILQVTDSARIVTDVYELLSESHGVRGVSLWTLPTLGQPARSGPSAGMQLPPGGVHAEGRTLAGRDDIALVPLGTGDPAQGPWALLAFWGAAGPQGWSLETKSVLDAVAGLVNPALRLNGEIQRREAAERESRCLNAELEGRVAARTRELARANAQLESLYELAQALAGAGSLPQVLSLGLARLARLAAAPACSLWRLRTGGLSCLAAHAPDGRDLRSALQGQAAAVAGLLLSSVDAETPPLPWPSVSPQGTRVPTRTAAAAGGGRVLLIPLGAGLPEVHALYLEVPDPEAADLEVPDLEVAGKLAGEQQRQLELLEAAAHAFGLAYERQSQALMIERAALSDELTGLPNRRALLSDLSSELSYSQRHRSALTLSLFELADIRTVNARQGFAAGNDLIRALADELRGTLRLEDRVYRLGGALLATLVRAHETGEQETVLARLGELPPRFMEAHAAAGALRLGHATSPGEGGQPSELLRLALTRLEADETPAPPPDFQLPDFQPSESQPPDAQQTARASGAPPDEPGGTHP